MESWDNSSSRLQRRLFWYYQGYRSRCIAIGERTGLYRDEIVAKNCTPNYLPKYIAIQVEKLKK